MIKKRYSNWPVGSSSSMFGTVDYATGTYTPSSYSGGSGSGLGQNTSGSGLFNWDSFLTNLLSSGTSIVNSIWGKGDSWKADAYNTLYEQEKKTNTILWVVIGLVVALGVFLVIRKAK